MIGSNSEVSISVTHKELLLIKKQRAQQKNQTRGMDKKLLEEKTADG